jgi:[ribosomal protein S5]-alanine N-acetyltransferase
MRKMAILSEPVRPAMRMAPAIVNHSQSIDWRQQLPVLTGKKLTLRELEVEDAATLFSMLSTNETARFISPPPTTIDGFRRFVEWAIREREHGNYVCFAIVPEGLSSAVGLFQVRALEPDFGTAEWGFALGSPYWGSGLFVEGAELVLDFVFQTVGVHRLEARASIANGRGNGALRKLGAVQEGVLRRSFLRNGEYHDQMLWSVLKEDWFAQQGEPVVLIH